MKRFMFALLAISMIISGCSFSKDSAYASPANGYTEITYLDNLSFYMPLNVINQATAVTQIVDGMEYNSNEIYSFNNGVDTYVLFCMDELIVLAQKGSSFDFFNTKDKVNALNNSGLLNTWFQPSGKRFSYVESQKNDIYKVIANVQAEVVITSELYGDYSGKLAVIQSGDAEWSLFVGAIAESTQALSENQLAVIDNITKSMCLKANVVKEEPVYDVVIDQTLKADEDAQKDIEETEEIAATVDEDTQPETTEVTQTDTETQSTEVIADTEEQIAEPREDPEVKENAAPSKNGFNISNQRKRQKDLSKAYSSDIYSMLVPGQCGILSVFTKDGVQEPVIRLNKVYTGSEAVDKIKGYVATQDVYSYFDAPDGYTWHLAEYDVSYENCVGTPYINIKLIGLDGKNLVFRGVPVTKRTHDASYEQEVDGNNIYKMYCYYAVANGCHEYALECGDGTADNESMPAAYYYINLK